MADPFARVREMKAGIDAEVEARAREEAASRQAYVARLMAGLEATGRGAHRWVWVCARRQLHCH